MIKSLLHRAVVMYSSAQTGRQSQENYHNYSKVRRKNTTVILYRSQAREYKMVNNNFRKPTLCMNVRTHYVCLYVCKWGGH